jgi:hypothetical protein
VTPITAYHVTPFEIVVLSSLVFLLIVRLMLDATGDLRLAEIRRRLRFFIIALLIVFGIIIILRLASLL